MKNKGYKVDFDDFNGFEQEFAFFIESEIERLNIEKEKKRLDQLKKKTDR